MNGLKTFLLKFIPITTLICFVAFGISLFFPNSSLTYLKAINTTSTTYYTFDIAQYVNNINPNNIIDAITDFAHKVAEIKNVFGQYAEIWENGYDLFDVTKTIVATILCVIDIGIIFINLILLVFRIILIIYSKVIALIGININADIELFSIFKSITEFQGIPYFYIIP